LGPHTLTLLGRGTGVVGGTITVQITAAEIAEFLIDGFFPVCEFSEQPVERRKIGLRAFGLDYASDPAVTRHLSAFLRRHCQRHEDGSPVLPTAVLFNGGVTKSVVFCERILEVLRRWSPGAAPAVTVLANDQPDLAVALGAAWHGCVQRCGGVRIKAGSARSYYVGVEAGLPAVPGFAPPLEALCVVNFGMEEGTVVDIAAEGLGLVVGEPTEFRFFSSTCRPDDQVGARLATWREDELQKLPPLVADLPVEQGAAAPIGTLVPVRLRTELTEVGTLQLWCSDLRGAGRWRLQFELRHEDGAPP
jgi:hypothetical protein